MEKYDYNLLAISGWSTSRCGTPFDVARTPVGDAPFDMFGSGGCSSGGFCSHSLCHVGKPHVRPVRSHVSTVRAAADPVDGEKGIMPSVSPRSLPQMKLRRSSRQPKRTMPTVAVRRTAPVLCLRCRDPLRSKLLLPTACSHAPPTTPTPQTSPAPSIATVDASSLIAPSFLCSRNRRRPLRRKMCRGKRRAAKRLIARSRRGSGPAPSLSK